MQEKFQLYQGIPWMHQICISHILGSIVMQLIKENPVVDEF